MDIEFVTIAVCRPCSQQCGRSRGYNDGLNPQCTSPRCACLCREAPHAEGGD